MHDERFTVALTREQAAARVARLTVALRWRIVSSVVSLLVLVAIIWFFGRYWVSGWSAVIVVLWLVSTAFWFAVSITGLNRAKRDLAGIPDGPAFHLDGDGVEVVWPVAVHVPWGEVSAVKAAGRAWGAGPSLVIEAGDAVVLSVPLTFLDTDVARLESAIQAYSLGRVRLDLTVLDNLV